MERAEECAYALCYAPKSNRCPPCTLTKGSCQNTELVAGPAKVSLMLVFVDHSLGFENGRYANNGKCLARLGSVTVTGKGGGGPQYMPRFSRRMYPFLHFLNGGA